MGDELPRTLYNNANPLPPGEPVYPPPSPPLPPVPMPPPAPPLTPISNFLDSHGTVVLLFALVVIALSGTFYLALHLKLDADKVFAYFSGFCTGAFSTMALGMKVGNAPK